MRLYQLSNGYCYNSDTLFLYDFISSFSPKGNLLDVGSGCGILGLLLKRDFDVNLYQIELQKDIYDINVINAKTNFLKSSIINDNYLNFKFDKKFDFIVSNPPFYDGNSKKSPNKIKSISRSDDMLSLEKFFKKTNSIITNRGYLIFCYRSEALQEIVDVSKEFKFNLEAIRFVHTNTLSSSKLALFAFKKSSNAKTVIRPSLISHESCGNFSIEAKSIFKKSATHSIKC